MNCYIGKMIGGNSALLLLSNKNILCPDQSNLLNLDFDCIINLSFLRCYINNKGSFDGLCMEKQSRISLSFCMQLGNLADINCGQNCKEICDLLKQSKDDKALINNLTNDIDFIERL